MQSILSPQTRSRLSFLFHCLIRTRAPWLLAVVSVLLLSSCASKKPKYEKVNYEAAKLATPPHDMQPHEYPFDAQGRYRKDWVKKGGSGRSKKVTNPPPNIPTSATSYASTSSSTPKPAPKPKPKARYHTVKKGDTLYGISRKYGTSVTKIKSTNGLRSDLIRIGQTLRIP